MQAFFWKNFNFLKKSFFGESSGIKKNLTKPYFIRKNSNRWVWESCAASRKKNVRKVHRNQKNRKETWKFNSKIDKNTMTLTADPKCKQYEDAWIIFQYSLLYRTVFQAIDGMNKKTAAFLLLRQSQKEGIYIVNVFKTKGRDRQNALPVKYEKVYFVPGLLSCYALQDTGKMCRNIVFDVKKLWNRCRIECSPGRKLLFSGMSFLEWKLRRERRRGGSCRSRLIKL